MTTEPLPRNPLWFLAPIGLDELTERAALQTRIDRKYVLPVVEAHALLDEIGPHSRVLEIEHARSFAYESVYFDTPELTSYLLAAHRRRRRFKVRTRTYLDSCLCWLEVKTRGPRGSTVKNRLPYQPADKCRVGPGRWFVDAVLAKEAVSAREALSAKGTVSGSAALVFVPTLITRYRRSTLFLPETTSRVTIDTELMWEDGYRRLWLPGLAIVETKTGSTASRVDRLLWARRRRPCRISKYATGLAALRADLPATRWHRTLRHHFAWGDAVVAPHPGWPPDGRQPERRPWRWD